MPRAVERSEDGTSSIRIANMTPNHISAENKGKISFLVGPLFVYITLLDIMIIILRITAKVAAEQGEKGIRRIQVEKAHAERCGKELYYKVMHQ